MTTAIAYHEAGHTVAAVVLGFGVESVTVVPQSRFAGEASFGGCCRLLLPAAPTPEQGRRLAVVALAGLAADEIVASPLLEFPTDDVDRARQHLLLAVGDAGADVALLLAECRREAFLLIEGNLAGLEALAAALAERGTLADADVRVVLQAAANPG